MYIKLSSYCKKYIKTQQLFFVYRFVPINLLNTVDIAFIPTIPSRDIKQRRLKGKMGEIKGKNENKEVLECSSDVKLKSSKTMYLITSHTWRSTLRHVTL